MQSGKTRAGLLAGASGALLCALLLMLPEGCFRQPSAQQLWLACQRCLLEDLADHRWIEGRLTAGFAHETWTRDPGGEDLACREPDEQRFGRAALAGAITRPGLGSPENGKRGVHKSESLVSTCAEACGAVEDEGQEQAIRSLVEQPWSLQSTAKAIAMLESLTTKHPDSAPLWSDLAAAYMARADRQSEQGADLLIAHAAAEKAVRLDHRLEEGLFNRALADEKLSFRQEAITSWSLYLERDSISSWADEARDRRSQLLRAENLPRKKERGDFRDRLAKLAHGSSVSQLQKLIQVEPGLTREFLEIDLLDEWARKENFVLLTEGFLLTPGRRVAEALAAVTGDRFFAEVMTSIAESAAKGGGWLNLQRDGQLEFQRGLSESKSYQWDLARPFFERALRLFAEAGSPMRFQVRYSLVLCDYFDQVQLSEIRESLDRLEADIAERGYTTLVGDMLSLHALSLFLDNQHLQSLAGYQDALDLFDQMGDQQRLGKLAPRRAGILRVLGTPRWAWKGLLPALADRHRLDDYADHSQVLGEAALTALSLNQPRLALRYQTRAIELLEAALVSRELSVDARVPLVVARRVRAELCLNLALSVGDEEVETRSGGLCTPVGWTEDLERVQSLLSQIRDPKVFGPLLARAREVQGLDRLVRFEPEAALLSFTEALALLPSKEFRTLRAKIYLERALAHFALERPGQAETDLEKSIEQLTIEARGNLLTRRPGEGEELWGPYSARFREVYELLIGHLLGANREVEAFSVAERSRAFEPRHLWLTKGMPAGCRELVDLEGRELLESIVEAIPQGTTVVEFAALKDELAIWILGEGESVSRVHKIRRDEIEGWVRRFHQDREGGDIEGMEARLKEISEAILWPVLKVLADRGESVERLVLIADGPIHSVPFAALRNRAGTRLVDLFATTTAPSALLYLCAVERDRQLPIEGRPTALLVGDPAFDQCSEFGRGYSALEAARQEIHDIALLYGPSTLALVEGDASKSRLFANTASHQVLHIAAHAVANPDFAERSYLLLAPTDLDAGVLFASDLIQQSFDRTRLVVLSACSTAGGAEVGPIGVAALVRPFLSSGVPAVVGSLWNVQSDATKPLMTAFHGHLASGLDVPEALRAAQRELIAKGKEAALRSPATWAAFQVVGYASSPFPQSDLDLGRTSP